ncbi:HD-GYP domain-containing protein [Paramaledivibacter caminithermalis]|jgi:HD-GYP domain-containing protein (c-di-GMP phosphodiesterase class II)|uniref:HD-GYP domain, c-di-GMP phosphodiesterase class II (Or its inactivated variant) n=1 Tax=Paramaledivibacter caminithermalis (strain DSM 15212 / CIP 107654 / DViRD3) TaxID=1121301 RepID=A0A1M6Q1F4_PARC5|nr:HD-GYP domain-containing protein [Paramaledivibacter caminithermalis]SHK13961.1 HD-GYP domain, c-di-GMP phosphodiesterase class II (or its inactivated variant) [Paramaledivibacter caminithermalis DSM 15212]
MKLISIDELKDGMILAEDIMGKHDILYARSGTILSEKLIRGLKKITKDFVYVVDGEEDDNKEQIIIVDKNLNKEYQRTISEFIKIFTNAKTGKEIVVGDLDETVNSLVDEIVKNNNILGRLRQIDVNEEYIYKHSINVSLISTMIGKWMNFRRDELYDIALAGLLHDIGKSQVPKEILNKTQELTEEELKALKLHTKHGYDILKKTSLTNDNIIFSALQHHERLDGKGYPLGLSGDNLNMYSKIVAVADMYDAMTSKSPKTSSFKVAEYIFQNSFGQLDPVIANIFLKNIYQFYVGNVVKLNNNKIGTVVLVNNYNPTKPLIKTSDEYIDLSVNYDYEIIDVIA